jgi:hypothetical protein
MTTRAHFAFRVDRWDQLGENILDHLRRHASDGRVKPSLCDRVPASSRTAGR